MIIFSYEVQFCIVKYNERRPRKLTFSAFNGTIFNKSKKYIYIHTKKDGKHTRNNIVWIYVLIMAKMCEHKYKYALQIQCVTVKWVTWVSRRVGSDWRNGFKVGKNIKKKK